jgi:DNA-directed RNA polymerase specialized sigma24 family protein
VLIDGQENPGGPWEKGRDAILEELWEIAIARPRSPRFVRTLGTFAEDIANEALHRISRILTGPEKLKPGGLAGLVHTVTVRLCLTWVRDEGAKPERNAASFSEEHALSCSRLSRSAGLSPAELAELRDRCNEILAERLGALSAEGWAYLRYKRRGLSRERMQLLLGVSPTRLKRIQQDVSSWLLGDFGFHLMKPWLADKRLDEPLLDVLRCRLLKGLSNKETAQLTNTNGKSVEKHFKRVTAILRKIAMEFVAEQAEETN